jgi:hypothetical protein
MGMSGDSKQGRKFASIDQLKKKPPVSKVIDLVVTTDDGTTEEVEMLFKSIGSKAYDDLIDKHPPTKKQKERNETYNSRTFAPALLAATCVEPAMDEEDWQEIFESDAWNRGELMMLFMQAVMINTQGLELVDPTETG